MVILHGTLIFKSSARAFATIDLGSGCEIGQQLYKEFGAGKLDRVDFQSVPTDEAQDAGYGFLVGRMRLGPRRNRHRLVDKRRRQE